MSRKFYLNTKTNPGILPTLGFFFLFFVISVMPTSAWAMGWFPDEKSCGTSENPTIGNATINEVYSLGNTHFVEIRIFDSEIDPDNLSLQICYPGNPKDSNECIQFDDFYRPVAHPYYVIDVGNNVLQLQKNDQMDIILYQEENRFLRPDIYYIYDYLSVNGYDHQDPRDENCDFGDLDTDITTTSNIKGIERSPDGTGDWKQLDRPGNNGEPTYGNHNEGGDLPDLHHLEIIHDGSAVACVPEVITLRACADAECSSLYLDGIDGTLTAGGNSRDFSIPAETADTEVSIYVPTDGTAAGDPQLVTLGLENLSIQPVAGYRCSNTSTDSDSCGIEVYKAGLVFDVPDQIAGVESGEVEIKAVQSSSPDTMVCTLLFESGERTIYFWGKYINPDTGKGETILFDENDIVETINKNATPDYNFSQNLTFTNGTATLPTVQYNDVGLMQLNARYVGSEEHEDTGMVVFGSDTFVVKPHHFSIDSIKCSDGTANPGATNSEEEKFCRAGDDFHVQVSARNAYGEITENFGHEDSPESVNIVSELVQPVGENAPELSALSVSALENCDGHVADATFCVTTSWPEVGIIKLIPGVGDGDYLEAGDVNETAVEYVGRFYPHHFELTPVDLTNRVESGCSDSTFTYMGENLEFTYTLTAINANGDITENYIGSFAKFEGETTSADYSIGAAGNIPDGSTTDLTSRLAIINVSRVADWTVGNAGFKVKLNVDRLNQPDGPFTDTRFGVFVRDSDEVEIEPLDLDVDIDGSDDYAQAATSTLLRYGRIRLENAHGSELLPLAMPIFIEYYKDGSFRFNTHDTCTKLTHASETDHIPFKLAQDEDSEDTDWSDANQEIDLVGSGNTQSLGFSEVSNAPSSPYIISSNTTLDNDPTNLILSPPGAGNTGHIFMHADLSDYPFLQYDWNGDDNYDDNPTARATFGIYKGNERIIYLRETTWR
jgi:MSHA biogenesis protein MshQ